MRMVACYSNVSHAVISYCEAFSTQGSADLFSTKHSLNGNTLSVCQADIHYKKDKIFSACLYSAQNPCVSTSSKYVTVTALSNIVYVLLFTVFQSMLYGNAQCIGHKVQQALAHQN